MKFSPIYRVVLFSLYDFIRNMLVSKSLKLNSVTFDCLFHTRNTFRRGLLAQPAIRNVILQRPKSVEKLVKTSFYRQLFTSVRRASKVEFRFDRGRGPAGAGKGPSGSDLLKLLVFVVAVNYTAYLLTEDEVLPKQISWGYFIDELLSKGEVAEIVVWVPKESSNRAEVRIKLQRGAIVEGAVADPSQVYALSIMNVDAFEERLRLAEASLGILPSRRIPVTYRRVGWTQYLLPVIVIGLFLLPYFWFQRRLSGPANKSAAGGKSFFDGAMSQLRSAPFKFVDSSLGGKTPNVFFKDVAGLHEAKMEIKEFVDYLKKPGNYAKLGAKLPRGSLLLGPPGCGKTLLAKAVATESGVPFFAVNGSEFVEMIGGLGAARVRELFKKAKQNTPCIIYIDEIDAIGRKRSESNVSLTGIDSEAEQTLNQLLAEMDGMSSDKSVIVLASTNRSDTLDKALLRPGRFDRHIMIDLPTRAERVELFDLYLKKIKLSSDAKTYASRLADLTPGFSGADIANVCNEAAIVAATAGEAVVGASHINQAMERIIAGSQKRSTSLSSEERKVVAYHESGHALVGWLLEHTDALLKVSIVPRTSAALGFAQYNPADRKLFSKEELFDRICMALGGRAAENVVFGRITTGAQDDLKKVTKIAYDQIQVYGMNENVGPLSFGKMDGQEFMKKPFSKKLQALIDHEANSLVTECYRKTEDLIRANLEKLNKIAQQLNQREVLHYEDVKSLIGPPAFGDKKQVSSIEDILPMPTSESGTS